MFASTLFADDGDRRDFERQVESLMRHGRVGEAAAIVEAALGELAKTEHRIAPLCLGCAVEDIELVGWDRLAERIAGISDANGAITGLGIDLSWPGHVSVETDAPALFEPMLETNYYSDAAFAFSTSGSDDLLGGYKTYGCEWAGSFEEIDSLLELRGLAAIYGAVAPLVERIRSKGGNDPVEADAMRLGALFVAVRVHQVVLRAISAQGLPQPMTVLVGSNESYPFLDAPVVSFADSAGYVIGPENASARHADDDQATTGDTLPSEPIHPSGVQLRQRFASQEPANDEAEVTSFGRLALGGRLARLFRR